MADSKLTALTAITTPLSTDIAYMVTDPGGTPLDRKVTWENATKALSEYVRTKSASMVAFDFTTDTAVGDGAGYFRVPSSMNGMNLVAISATVITAGTTGTTDVQIANITQAADMLSTKLTVDSGETDSSTAATPAVIDAANDDVATADLLRVDVDAVSTTAAKGLIINLEFRLP